MIDYGYALWGLTQLCLLGGLALVLAFGIAALWDLFTSGPDSLAGAGTTRGGVRRGSLPAARRQGDTR